MADVGCRNTVFGAEAQVAARYMDDLQAAGVRHYRLEFVHESADDVRAVTAAFRAYFAGETDADALDTDLARAVHSGTNGGFAVRPE